MSDVSGIIIAPHRKRIAGWKAAGAMAWAFTAALSAAPVGELGPRLLGTEYTFGLRGQNITEAEVGSHETLHRMTLSYAPVEYVRVGLGLGLDKFLVDSHNGRHFRGGYGPSPYLGLSLFTPGFLDGRLRGTAGLEAMYMRSEHGSYVYHGFFSNPYLGALVSPHGYFDVEAGFKGHVLDGYVDHPLSGSSQGYFSNGEIFRGYLSMTVKSPHERVFLTLSFEASPALSGAWSNGPAESALAVSVGGILSWHERKADPTPTRTHWPSYGEMKDMQKRMVEELE